MTIVNNTPQTENSIAHITIQTMLVSRFWLNGQYENDIFHTAVLVMFICKTITDVFIFKML